MPGVQLQSPPQLWVPFIVVVAMRIEVLGRCRGAPPPSLYNAREMRPTAMSLQRFRWRPLHAAEFWSTANLMTCRDGMALTPSLVRPAFLLSIRMGRPSDSATAHRRLWGSGWASACT